MFFFQWADHVLQIYDALLIMLDVIFTDFQKDFDPVDHFILLEILIQFGFAWRFIEPIRSYPFGRAQLVVVEGLRCQSFIVTSGVPQGSNLGLVLFTLFINYTCVSLFNVINPNTPRT